MPGSIVGRPYHLAMGRQRDLPALLPAAEGEQISFALGGSSLDVDPEADCGIVGIQLHGIIRHSLVIYAIKLISLIGAVKTVITTERRYGCVIPVGRHILPLPLKDNPPPVHRPPLAPFLGSVQIRYLLGG